MCIYKNLLVYSNLVFVIAFIYLLFNKKNHECIMLLLIGIISALYHTYETDHLYLLDVFVAISIFIFLYLKYKANFNYVPLLILLLYYIVTYISYYYNIKAYSIMHTLWHLFVCIYVVHIIMKC